MSTLLTIPLCQLKASKSNVRKTDRLADIEPLAASIEANGLLENLVVQPVLNGKANTYEVIAGGRRFSALKLLVKQKKVENDHPIACLVLEPETRVAEVSLAENFARLPLHPADQFEAFAALAKNLSANEIGARFGVTPTFVAQRLKLASVSPRLIAEYRSAAMTLEQLTAFTLSGDRKAQEEVWFDSPYEHLSASDIRSLLTRSHVGADDPRARFVGLQTYEAAGGNVVRDLFDAEDEGLLADSQLLDRLVAEKLEEAAMQIRAEGWQWVEVHPDADGALLSEFEHVSKTAFQLGDEEEQRLAALCNRYDELVAALQDEGDHECPELDQVSSEITRLQERKEFWSDEQKALSGAIVSIDWRGELFVSRGLLKDSGEDEEAPENAPVQPGPTTKPKAPKTGYPDGVVLDLSAHRTATLRAVLATDPQMALRTLLYALVEQLMYSGCWTSCLDLRASEVVLEREGTSVAASRAAEVFRERHATWQERLPKHEALWSWLSNLTLEGQLALLAHCVALTVDALELSNNRGRHTADSWTTLAQALSIDMSAWWRPSAARFFMRLTKGDILIAVAEGVSEKEARHLDGLKKDQMAEKAETLLGPTKWLPLALKFAEATPDSGAAET